MRPIYIGANNKAVQNDSIYLGVNNIAKKVSRMYIGDENGVARLCYSAEQSIISDDHVYIDVLDMPYNRLCSITAFNDKIVFAGGRDNDDYDTVIDDIYLMDDSGTITQCPNSLSLRVYSQQACVINDKYIAFVGGVNYSDSDTSKVQIYDKSMTLVQETNLDYTVKYGAEGYVGKYGLIFGGIRYLYAAYNTTDSVIAISDTLTIQYIDGLCSARQNAGCACNKYHAIVACGNKDVSTRTPSNDVDVYDENLTHSILSKISTASFIKGTTVGEYYLFASPHFESNNAVDTVDVYDKNLTKCSDLHLSHQKTSAIAFTTGDQAIYAGGYYPGDNFNTYYEDELDIFDRNLTHSTSLLNKSTLSKLKGARIKDSAVIISGDGYKSCEIIKLK